MKDSMREINFGSDQSVWQQYRKWVLAVLLGILVVYGGLQTYQYYQLKTALKASKIYDEMLSQAQAGDKAGVRQEGMLLTQKFAQTPYAPLAALVLAKLAIEEQDIETAKNHLRFAMQASKGPAPIIARTRLARILADQQQYEEALALLSPKTIPEGYLALFEESKGDIYLLQNQKEKASIAYGLAIEATPAGVPMPRLQLKQADVGIMEEAKNPKGNS